MLFQHQESYCQQVRGLIYGQASKLLQNDFPFEDLQVGAFVSADFEAIRDDWTLQNRRYPHWDWKKLHQDVVNKRCRFEAVIRNHGTAIGVVIGKPDKQGIYLGIPFLEAFPGEHPLAGETARYLLTLAESYAAELGLKEVRLLNPIVELLDFYEELEFTVVRPEGKELDLTKETGE